MTEPAIYIYIYIYIVEQDNNKDVYCLSEAVTLVYH